MKKIISLLIFCLTVAVVMFLCLVNSLAAGVEELTFTLNEDGISYTLSECSSSAEGDLIIPGEYNGLPVTKIGSSAFYDCNITFVDVPDTVTTIGYSAFKKCSYLEAVKLSANIKKINSYAFEYCESLKEIVIPDGLTVIEYQTFRGCENLSKVTFPESLIRINNNAFASCTKLEQVDLPSGLEEIDRYAFYRCGLKSVTLPEKLKSLGEGAFNDCLKLEEILVADGNKNFSSKDGVLFNKTKSVLVCYPQGAERKNYKIPSTVRTIGESAFEYNEKLVTVEFPKKLKTIGKYAFYMCEGLTEISLPDSVELIENQAFSLCEALIKVKLPKNLKSIKYGVFEECTSLQKVTFSTGLKSIGKRAFADCTSLTSINVPTEVVYIRSEAFEGCKKLKSITLPDGLKSISEYAFYGTAYYKNKSNWKNRILYIGNHLIKARASLNSPFKIKSTTKLIADGAFMNCEKITGIDIPGTVVNIGNKAFYGCSSLFSVDIPDSVKYLGEMAFRECYKLTAVTIGDRVEEIGRMCFYYCPRITKLTIGRNVKKIGSSAFYNCDNLTSLEFPDDLKSIGDHAFYDCDGFNSFYIPESVSSIGEDAIGYYVTCDEGDEIIYSDFKIYAKKGSAAEKYAKKVGLRFVKHITHKKAQKPTVKQPTVNRIGYKYVKCTICHTELGTEILPEFKCSRPTVKSVKKSGDAVKITWDKIDGGDVYRVYRRVNNGQWKYLDSTKATSFTDKTVKSGKTYYYRVRAKNEAGLSRYDKKGVSIKYKNYGDGKSAYDCSRLF